MSKRPGKYLPFLPVLAAYSVLFIYGRMVPGKWQLVAMLAFFGALGQAFNLFMGMTGYVDFGYVAFLGIGTYGMAIAIWKFSHIQGMGPWVIVLGLLMAAGMATLLSLAVGAVALRLRGAYFAIATIGVNEGFRYLIEGAKLWNGSEGIIFSGQMNQMFGREAASAISTFWADVMVFAIALISAFVTLVYMRNRVGYALTALREDEDAAKVMGIYVTKYKIIAFITSAVFAGLLGACAWALKLTYVFPPDVFEIHYTIEAIIIVMLGGAGTLLGPVFGGLIYGGAKYWLAILFSGQYPVTIPLVGWSFTLPSISPLLLFAPIILIIIVAFPEGTVGVLKRKTRGTALEKWIV